MAELLVVITRSFTKIGLLTERPGNWVCQAILLAVVLLGDFEADRQFSLGGDWISTRAQKLWPIR
jgi:hypothetical protein